MNTETHTTQTPLNSDELAATVSTGHVRGTDNNGNYTFMPYSPKAPVTANVEGYRVSKLMYKVNPNTGKAAGENSCAIVPHITWSDVEAHIEQLRKHIISMLESEQDKLIRKYHLDKVTFIRPEQISLDAIVEAMEAVAVSGRLNKEMIGEWFASYMKENLTLLLSDKLGLSNADTVQAALADKSSKLSLMLKTYSDMFGKMASNTTVYQPVEAEKLLQAINAAVDTEEGKQDTVTLRLREKLDKMMKPAPVADLLGF